MSNICSLKRVIIVNASSILNVVGYATATVVTGAGIAVLMGIIPSYVPEQYRIMLGIIMVVYGAFRGGMIWIRQKNNKRDAEMERKNDNE